MPQPPLATSGLAVAEHAIPCSWCGAVARIRCTTKRGRPLPILSHQTRIDDWAATPKES